MGLPKILTLTASLALFVVVLMLVNLKADEEQIREPTTINSFEFSEFDRRGSIQTPTIDYPNKKKQSVPTNEAKKGISNNQPMSRTQGSEGSKNPDEVTLYDQKVAFYGESISQTAAGAYQHDFKGFLRPVTTSDDILSAPIDRSSEGFTTYCEEVQAYPPHKANKLYFIDRDLGHLRHFHSVLKDHGWLEVPPLPIPAYRHRKGKTQKVKSEHHAEAMNHSPTNVRMVLRFKQKYETTLLARPGIDFACNGLQYYNRIPEWSKMLKKNIEHTLREWQEKLASWNLSHCFPREKMIPEVYLLNDEEECKQFFDLMTPEMQKEVIEPKWILKDPDIHQGKGVTILGTENARDLYKKWSGGRQCGLKKTTRMVQYYIPNPLTLQRDAKFDLRLFMLISSTDPLVAFYHDGFLRLSMNAYDKASESKKAGLTNLSYVEAQGPTTKGYVESEYTLDIDGLEETMYSMGITTNPNFVREHIVPQVKRLIAQLVLSVADSFTKSKTYWEICGIDFIIDDDFNVWFLELNRQNSWDEIRWDMKSRALNEAFSFLDAKTAGAFNTKELPHKHWQPVLDMSLPPNERFFGLYDEDCYEMAPQRQGIKTLDS